MRIVKLSTVASFALTAAGFAQGACAADQGQWTLGLSGGTLGVGPEIAYRYGPNLGMRVNAGYFSYNRDQTLDDIDYNGKLKLNSVGLQADWYPFGGGFRLSLGGRSNSNKIDLKGNPSSSVEIDGTTYTPAEVGTLTGTVKSSSFAPTFALGYGGTLAKGFTMGVELGVMYQGSPKINDLHSSGGLFSSNPIFLADVKAEQQRMEDDAKDFKYWPVLQIDLLYRF